MADVSTHHHLGHRLHHTFLLAVWFLHWQVAGCSPQYQFGIPQGYYGGIQQYPVYTGSYYQRPQNIRWPTYGYDYNVGNIRTPDSYDQMIDNAQKAAMQPLNNLMASQADALVPQQIQRTPESSSPSVQGRDDAASYAHQTTFSQSKQCRTPGCPSAEDGSEDIPEAKASGAVAEPAPVRQTNRPQTFHGGRQYAPPSPCPQCPPCSHPYPGFNANSDGLTKYAPDNPPQVYYTYYSYPQGASRSARTYWLPWLNGGPIMPQNTINYRYHYPYKRNIYQY